MDASTISARVMMIIEALFHAIHRASVRYGALIIHLTPR